MYEIVIEIFSTSMCCSGDHKLVYNDKGLAAFFIVSYKDMKKILNCLIKEQKFAIFAKNVSTVQF